MDDQVGNLMAERVAFPLRGGIPVNEELPAGVEPSGPRIQRAALLELRPVLRLVEYEYVALPLPL